MLQRISLFKSQYLQRKKIDCVFIFEDEQKRHKYNGQNLPSYIDLKIYCFPLRTYGKHFHVPQLICVSHCVEQVYPPHHNSTTVIALI